jgi:hypothetical protein
MKRQINKNTFLVVCILIFASKSFAQTYALADTNFIKYLKNSYPYVLNAQDSLIISAAATVTFNINTPDYGIKNLDGIQYFKNVPVLDIYRNNIDYIPKLDSLKKLKQIFAFKNRLDTFPAISHLIDLNKLYLGDNKLSYLPAVNNNKKLIELHCHTNNLKALPNVDSLINLRSFHFGNNPALTNLPALNKLAALEEVYFFQCNVSVFPDISHNLNLKKIYAGFNNYNSLPDFTIFPNLDVVEVTHCNLTFEDLIPLAAYPGFDTIFLISPQNKIGNEITIIKDELTNFTISLNIDNSVSTNIYKWYRDAQLIATTAVASLVLDTIRIGDAGNYTCETTNTSPGMNGVTLYSNPVHLIVNNYCLNTQHLSYIKKDIVCNGTGEFLIDTSSISGGVKPYTYQLKHTFSGMVLYSNEGKFSNLNDGNYSLLIKDKIGCTREVTGIELIRKGERNSGDCKGIAITPDGDNINDTYYISEPGEAKIFNSKGHMIKKLSTPAYWDGTSSNGQIIGDYYLIEINKDTIINITVIH